MLEIIYNNIPIKQHSRVTYLGCILEETISGELMVHKAISKVNFDYACSAWYPDLSKKLKNNSNFTKQMHLFLSTVR